LGLKATRRGHETWVTTLYATSEMEVRRRLRKAKTVDAVIREHE
jgi:hypothetical protein